MSGKFEMPLSEREKRLSQLLQWAEKHYSYFSLFVDNDITYPHGGFPLLFLGGNKKLNLEEANEHYGIHEMAGILSYDYKNKIEDLKSENPEAVSCPESVFFIPEIRIHFGEDDLRIIHPDSAGIFEEISFFPTAAINPKVEITAWTSKEAYIVNIEAIQKHIKEGDMYEMNYCIGHSFEGEKWDPITGFMELMQVSPMPFSSFFKANDQYLICASPERFIKKEGDRLIAQPIKGTMKRGRDAGEDLLFKKQLLSSEKERAENLMIVDLMRNDLSKISETGSVEVEELFGVYAFPKVFQMISTVSSRIKRDQDLLDIFQATFPMGSMTGAPKIKCMELIERYENFKRGWFSGSIGYISPNGDFDFNVIIRSIVFDRAADKGFFAVGSAVTYDADAAYEYGECQLKAAAIMKILAGK